MKVPQENSPVVRAPTTRSGGGSRVLMSSTWAVISRSRNCRISRSKSAADTCAGVACTWFVFCLGGAAGADEPADRKSTRLNSSHGYISYAVFCLKKKKYHIDEIKRN